MKELDITVLVNKDNPLDSKYVPLKMYVVDKNENNISLEVLINECGNSEVFSDKEYRYAYKKSKILLSKRC